MLYLNDFVILILYMCLFPIHLLQELSGNVEHFRALERFMVKNNSKVEDIFCLNEINEQQMNLALKNINLDVLPMMTCLFVGPKNSFSLQNLKSLKIMRCEKLKIVFSTSMIRCLPQLVSIIIEECKELKQMIEDDLENKTSSNFMSTTKTCFPKLETLAVVKCNKLKYVFPISICKELPALNYLIIREADELEEIFGSEGDQKVKIRNLKVVAFVNLASLCHGQGIQFQAVKHRFIRNCQKLSLASASTADFENDLSAGLYIGTHSIQYFFKLLHVGSKILHTICLKDILTIESCKVAVRGMHA